MDITPVNWSQDVLSSAHGAARAPSAQDREVVRAVKALNGAGLTGQDQELVFQRDAQTQRMVIRLVDRKTSEVISQFPRGTTLIPPTQPYKEPACICDPHSILSSSPRQ